MSVADEHIAMCIHLHATHKRETAWRVDSVQDRLQFDNNPWILRHEEKFKVPIPTIYFTCSLLDFVFSSQLVQTLLHSLHNQIPNFSLMKV